MTTELVIKMGWIGFIIGLIMLIAIDVADIIRYWRNKRTADPNPVKHGHWKEDSTCSVCGKKAIEKIIFSGETIWEDKYDYCPHCGAKMDGGRRWQD